MCNISSIHGNSCFFKIIVLLQELQESSYTFIKGMLLKPKKYNNTPTPLENIDVNKLYNKLR